MSKDNYEPSYQEFADMFGGMEALDRRIELELAGFDFRPRARSREISRRSAGVLLAIAKRSR